MALNIAIFALMLGMAACFVGCAVAAFSGDKTIGGGIAYVLLAVLCLMSGGVCLFEAGSLHDPGKVALDAGNTQLSIGEVYEVVSSVNVPGEKAVCVLRRTSDNKLLAYQLRGYLKPPKVFVRRSEQQAKEKIQDLERIGKEIGATFGANPDDYLYGPVDPAR